MNDIWTDDGGTEVEMEVPPGRIDFAKRWLKRNFHKDIKKVEINVMKNNDKLIKRIKIDAEDF